MNRFGRFNVAGALGVGVQLGVLWLLVHGFSANHLVATGVAVLAAILHNFLWHWRWTWADRPLPRSGVAAALLRFTTANGLVSFVGNIALMATFVNVLHVPVLAANLMAIGVCALVNYQLADRLVFPACP